MISLHAHETSAFHLRPYRFKSAALTHAGSVRKLNEDAVLDRPDIGLWAVADGMGGHAAGDFASQCVIRHLQAVRSFTSAFDFRRGVRAALLSSNMELQAKADSELLDRVGSTVVTLLVHRGHYACIWAGDSRAYRVCNGQLERITRDHTLVRDLVDAGSMSLNDAKSHMRSNVITRAVGGAAKLDLDGVHGSIESGGRFILCSDGLGVLSDAEISSAIETRDAERAASALLQAALDRGAPDNVSVIVVDVQGANA